MESILGSRKLTLYMNSSLIPSIIELSKISLEFKKYKLLSFDSLLLNYLFLKSFISEEISFESFIQIISNF